MQSMSSLLDPKAIAVVGASQRRSRGTSVMTNLRDSGFKGEIYAVNPRYQDILGYTCVASVADLPPQVDCLVVAIGADAACDVLEEAYAHGIRAAVVLAAGFGEGGHGETRAARLRALAAKGMCICGPNCFGLISVKASCRVLQRNGAETAAARAGRPGVAERRLGRDGVQSAHERARARLRLFRLLRQPDRRDD